MVLTVDLVVLGDETVGADGVLADAAAEATVVPLPASVFHLLGACGGRFGRAG